MGASIGRFFSTQLKEQETTGLTLDHALIVEGFKQGLQGDTQLTEEEMQKIIKGLEEKINEKRRIKAEEIAKENLEKGTAFLAENKTKKGVKVTDSGLQYEVLTAGEGQNLSSQIQLKSITVAHLLMAHHLIALTSVVNLSNSLFLAS